MCLFIPVPIIATLGAVTAILSPRCAQSEQVADLPTELQLKCLIQGQNPGHTAPSPSNHSSLAPRETLGSHEGIPVDWDLPFSAPTSSPTSGKPTCVTKGSSAREQTPGTLWGGGAQGQGRG